MAEKAWLKYVISYKLHSVLKLLYPLRDNSKPREKPLEVLALGLSRCGTDSLRIALEELGYTRCYHGYVCQMEERPDAMTWSKLMAKKFSQRLKDGKMIPEPIDVSRAEFDRVLWDCAAVTDQPAAIFGPELIRAYPEAKVIINRRNDIDAWASSMRVSVLTLVRKIKWLLYVLSWFDARNFWVTRVHLWMSTDYFGGDFEKYGKAIYEEHYDRIKEMLEPGSYLEWTVQDGWEPLCAFLGKPVPTRAFPDGNKLGDWQEKTRQHSREMILRSIRKFFALLLITSISTTAYATYRRRKRR